ncbi:MAG: 7-cyano-7-deazaguanine synthase [Bacteroidales bacterium]|nr:7-cyano-7-deazaguanine synthase [Bacteroidales bacterium]
MIQHQVKKLKKELQRDYLLLVYLWPLLRKLVKNKLTKRCTVCTLNEKYTVIGDDGICNICRKEQQNPVILKSEDNVDQLFMDAQGKGKGLYDALVFFSGGKDSTYLLTTLQKKYKKLRILAFTIDNGFRSPFGEENVKEICKHFGIEHLEIRPFNMFKKLYRYGFENFSHKGFYATDIWEGELFMDIGRNIAAQMQIPLTVLGYTPQQLSIIEPGYDEYKLYNSSQAIYKENQKFTRETFLGHRLDSIFTPDEMKYWWDFTRYSESELPIMVLPFNAWGYNKDEIQKEVSQMSFLTKVNPMFTNDLYCQLGIYLDYKILGYCSFEPEWAAYVREMKADNVYNRNTWEIMEYGSLYSENQILNSINMKMVLDQLGMTKKDVSEIIRKCSR